VLEWAQARWCCDPGSVPLHSARSAFGSCGVGRLVRHCVSTALGAKLPESQLWSATLNLKQCGDSVL